MSHPARGAWIEIVYRPIRRSITLSRTPQGVRGLKSKYFKYFDSFAARRTPQGVRGLKFAISVIFIKTFSRTPQGVRGLKYWVGAGDARTLGRTPQGVRGLKLVNMISLIILVLSHPARGAWIEIMQAALERYMVESRTPQGVRGLKCNLLCLRRRVCRRRTPQGVRGLK